MASLKNSILYRVDKAWKKTLSFIFSLLPIRSKKVVFRNFAGSGYGDNPKYIAQKLLDMKLNYDLVWQLSDMKTPLPDGIRKVRFNSVKAIFELSTAKVIITNVKNLQTFRKRSSQYYIQTWHSGFTVKQIEKAASLKLSIPYIENSKKESAMTDLLLSNSRLQTKEYQENFWYEGEILECGLPRNDAFFCDRLFVYESVRQKLGIKKTQLFVLYAPTFRDNGEMSCYHFNYSNLIDSFRMWGKQPVLGIRLHPNIATMGDKIASSDNVLNLSYFPDMNELLLAADVLVTDYSSSMFDFGLLNKPVFLYTTDIEEYKKMRGLKDIFYRLPFPLSRDEEELFYNITSFKEELYFNKTRAFFETEYMNFDDGHASEAVVKRIKNIIDGKSTRIKA